MFGVVYHVCGKDLDCGIIPLIKSFNLTSQEPKLGKDTIAYLLILTNWLKTFSGECVACKV